MDAIALPLDCAVFASGPASPRLALLRHAESLHPAPDYFTVPGAGLSAIGRRQVAALLAEMAEFCSFAPREILSSPFSRCLLTAGPLGKMFDVPVKPDSRLEEFNPVCGDQELLRSRLDALLNDIGGEPALLVTHGVVVEAIMRLSGVTDFPQRTPTLNVIEPAGCFRSDGNGRWVYLRPAVPSTERFADG